LNVPQALTSSKNKGAENEEVEEAMSTAIHWAANLEEALAHAGRERRFVLADFARES
jgi:hypothetical protein